MENKKIIIALCAFILAALIFAAALFLSEAHLRSENYTKTLSLIENGNAFVIGNNWDDGCFPYRYFHRGCYYSEEKHYVISSALQNYGLQNNEITELCYKFAHKGAVAYCLKTNREIQKCREFAGNNEYLNRICSLEDGEVIPSNTYGPYENETGWKVDDFGTTVEPVHYSKLASE